MVGWHSLEKNEVEVGRLISDRSLLQGEMAGW